VPYTKQRAKGLFNLSSIWETIQPWGNAGRRGGPTDRKEVKNFTKEDVKARNIVERGGGRVGVNGSKP